MRSQFFLSIAALFWTWSSWLVAYVTDAFVSTGPGRIGWTTTCGRSTGIIRESLYQISDVDERLYEIARRLKLEIFDLDEGVFGFDTQDQHYGLEVIRTDVDVDGGLGLVLTEMAGSEDGRGLVLVSEVSGNAARADPPIHIGDVITGVLCDRERARERTTGLNYDLTVEAIGRIKEATDNGRVTLELNRMVERARVRVEVDDGSGKVTILDALAGENLRRLLLRKNIQLYDHKTKRFDMPFATGDCAGEGLCGTCLVAVERGKDGAEELSLNPKDDLEELITRGRPLSWRASCRTVLGADNRPGTIRIKLRPQSRFKEELDPGVRPVS